METDSFSIPLYSSDVKFEVKNTNFRKAEYYGEVFKETNKSEKGKSEWTEEEQDAIDQFYKSSGIKFVMEALISKKPLENIILNVFAEIITIASTIQDKKITSFMGVLENPSDHQEVIEDKFKEKVNTNFQKVIKGLEGSKNLLTYKKNFFLQPEKPLGLISISKPQDTENIIGTSIGDSEETPHITDYTFKKLILNSTQKKIVNPISNNCSLWLKKDIIFERDYNKIVSKAMNQAETGRDLEENNEYSHLKYHDNFASDKNNRSALLSIPFISSAGVYNEDLDRNGENPKFQGYGALFVFIEFRELKQKKFETPNQYKEKIKQYEEILKETLQDFAKEIAISVGKFAVNYLFETAKVLYNQTKKKSRQAAIAQIMLRNMSHNIGSHVLSRMVTSERATGFPLDGQYMPVEGLNSEPEINSCLAWFNSYLKTRMDFLADIATSVPVMEDTRMLLTEVIAGLDRNQILLNNISGVEKFDYRICVKDCRTDPNTACEPLVPTSGKDIPIAMPNDILGYHALYIILENVVRNTAKHGSRPENNCVVFTLEVRSCEKDDSLYEVWLYDNCVMKQKDGEEEKSGKKKNLVQDLNEKIDSEVLDPNNSLRQGAWGMIEMKVSAAYLRKIAVGDVDEERYKLFDHSTTSWNEKEPNLDTQPIILKAESTTNQCLAYVFHLMKPKQLIVVDEKGTLYGELAKEVPGKKSKLGLLKEHGIWVSHTEDGRTDDDKFDAMASYPHPFMLIIPNNEFSEETYLKKDGLFKGNLPPRLLVVTDSDNTKSDSWWVVQVKEAEVLMNAIKAGRVKSEIPTKADDLEHETVMNLIWREWLKSKLDFLKLSGLKAEGGKKYISSAFDNYVLPVTEDKERDFSFVLDHHGQNLNFKAGKSNYDHFEAYPSLVIPTLERCRPAAPPPTYINPNFDKNELCKIVEGMLTKIIIIDERVQQAYQSEYWPDTSSNPDLKSVKKEILYRAANIHIPSKTTLDLNKAEFEENYKERLFNEIKRISGAGESRFTGIDYIVIHLGVIEKILSTTGQDKKEKNVLSFVRDLANCPGANGSARIVITSGRGKPDNLPDEIPFMAYSVLSQYAIEVPFKSYLTQAVSATRLAGSN